MALVLNEGWTADVAFRTHKYRITNKELAERCGYDKTYLSTVLNGNKRFESAESAELTKRRILTALAQLEAERLREVESGDSDRKD